MKKRIIILVLLLIFVLTSCINDKKPETTTDIPTITTIPTTTNTSDKIDYELVDFNKDVKTKEVINPGMGFYRTRYLTLKRESTIPTEYDFERDSFYHVRIDISDFSKANNDVADYDISDSAIELLKHYFKEATYKDCTMIIRFAYDGYEGKANKEPEVAKIIDHIKSLASVINEYRVSIIAVECGLIGPWGEMHTSTLDTQETYNQILPVWLSEVRDLPILVRKPVFIYKYLNYTLDNLDTFNEENIRLGLFNDGYYGTNLDQGTYESLEARDKETKFIAKLGNLTGGECIGEPTELFSYEEIIREMNLINLTYLNYEWNNDIVLSWKNKTYDNQSFYTYMVNHMGFKLYVDNFNINIDNNMMLNLEIDLANMGFSHITRELTARIYIDNDERLRYSNIDDSSLSLNLGVSIRRNSSVKIYLKISDIFGRTYELMNGVYENGMNYLGEVIIK